MNTSMNLRFVAASRQSAASLAFGRSAALCRDAATPGFMATMRVQCWRSKLPLNLPLILAGTRSTRVPNFWLEGRAVERVPTWFKSMARRVSGISFGNWHAVHLAVHAALRDLLLSFDEISESRVLKVVC
jgi:hypothetical protein